MDFRILFEEEFLVDEVGFSVSLRPLYGRSKRGTSPVAITVRIRLRNNSTSCTVNKNVQESIFNLIIIGLARGIFVMDIVALYKTLFVR
ncbi:hypothetical protein AYI69_g8462 [Smittium culicis]|uniref:Uncharacterized protein n=1 Tax=Smittium culicis TaxID=133412 RepID=A0A1R1XJD7_9FUNG|nr:hypothetical protein AYI69_g8462 [Smittium culicis]